MKCAEPSQSVSHDAQILGLAISRAIRCSEDEKDALRRICTLLDCWGVPASPCELGALRQDA